MQNRYQHLIPQQAAPAGGLPQVIEGPPREAPPQTAPQAQQDVLQVRQAEAALQRAPVQLRQDEAALARTPYQIEQDRIKAQRDALALQREREAAARGPGADAAESERTAAFLATRLTSAARQMAEATRADPTGTQPSIVQNTVRSVFGETAANYITPAQRQVVEGAQVEILDTALTLGTGAAYTREQLEGQRRALFPQPGDQPAEIAAKRERLLVVLQAARVKAGAAAPQIDAALQALGLEGGPTRHAPGSQTADNIGAAIAQARQQPQGEADGDLRVGVGMWNGLEVRSGPDGGPAYFDPATGQQVDPQTRQPIQAQEVPGGIGRSLGLFGGALAETAGDALGLIGNPLNYGINAALGTDLSTDLGASFRSATGAPTPQTDTERLADTINRGGLGALSLTGLARGGVRIASGAAQNALRTFGARPVADAVGGAVAGGSAEGARQAGVGPAGQTLAALAGGIGGGLAAQRVGNALAPRVAVQTPLTQAGRAERVDVNRAMIDPNVQPQLTGTAGSIVGARVLNRDVTRIGSQIEGRVQALGRGGAVLEDAGVGQTVTNAARRFIGESGQRARRMYDAAETAASGVRVPPQRSLQEIDTVLARLNETPETNGAEIAFMQRLRNDFASDLSVDALRRVRTCLRSRIRNGGLTFGEDEASVLGIMDSASQDIEQGLQAAGRGRAATLFRQADDFYRDRMEFINGAVQNLIGRRNANLPPERVAQNLRSMASRRGDSQGLARVLQTMEPEEQLDVAATFANSLGRNTAGEFSTADFLKHVEQMPRAVQTTVFGGQGVQSIRNLELLAAEHKRVRGAIGGSPTGLRNDFRGQVMNLIFSGGLGVATGSATNAMAVGGAALGIKATRDLLSARALMSTDLTRWAARTPRGNNPAAIRAHLGRLTAIAGRNPAIAEEIGQLQQVLGRAMNDNMGSVPAVADPRSDQQGERR